jgi:tripartite-type tricarboxylate transporter receptor subunit TctC
MISTHHRREFISQGLPLGLGASLLGAISPLVRANDKPNAYPNRPIKLIVAYPPGGNTDLVARIYANALAASLKQPVVVDNRPGAGGAIGMTAAAKSPNDGYTMVIGDMGSLCINRFALPSLGYDPVKDFAAISTLAKVSILITGRLDLPVKSMAEFIQLAKANPNQFACGTAGTGTIGHLSLELLNIMAGIQVRHVPYKGGAAALNDLMGGHIDLLIDGTALGQAKNGKVKALATTGERIAVMPEVETLAQAGVKGYNLMNFWGYLFPVGTPKECIDRLSSEVHKMSQDPEIQKLLSASGLVAISSSPEEFNELIRSENRKIEGVIKDAHIVF